MCESKKPSPGDLGEGGQEIDPDWTWGELEDYAVSLRERVEELEASLAWAVDWIGDVVEVPLEREEADVRAEYDQARALLKDGER